MPKIIYPSFLARRMVGGWRPSLLLLAKTITHPAARSLCDSWSSILFYLTLTIISSFIWTKYGNVTDRQTDGRTESLWLSQRSALRAMRASFTISWLAITERSVQQSLRNFLSQIHARQSIEPLPRPSRASPTGGYWCYVTHWLHGYKHSNQHIVAQRIIYC